MKAAIIGGDTDSNAAMLGALIGGIRGVRFVPLHYVEAVENGAEVRLCMSQLSELALTRSPASGPRGPLCVAVYEVSGE